MKLKTGQIICFAISLIVILIMEPHDVLAQELTPTPSDDEVNSIARELYCPVCENVPLDVCSTQACAQWRELIREQLAEGKQPEEIKQYFAEQYGEQVLTEPSFTGMNRLIYLLPVLFMMAGFWVVLRILFPGKSKIPESTVPIPVDETEQNTLEETLRKFRVK
jgi:cytochrome c-type biogenesis protein CcmH